VDTIAPKDERKGMPRPAKYFLRGAVIALPVALTFWISWRAIRWIDSWLGLPIPGVGLLVVIGAMILVGMLATNVVTRAALDVFDSVMTRLPIVRLLYNAAKDLMQAFAGEKRRFSKAVRVRVDPEKELWILGFVTVDDATRLGLPDHVGVYLPQSYNFAGQFIVVPATQVERIQVESSEHLTFILSGGVAEGGGKAKRGRRTSSSSSTSI
jgi:uncharacterized membrane protein